MKLNKILEGIQIIQKYYDNPDGDGFYMESERDLILMTPTHKEMALKDFKKLKELGWFQETEEFDMDALWQAYL